MSETSRELSFSLALDGDGRPFATDVSQAVRDAAVAGAAQTAPLRRSLSELFTSGLLLRLGAGAFALRRIMGAAGELSPGLRAARQEAGALAQTVGSELQGAVSGVAAAGQPFLHWLNETNAGVRGGLIGATAFVFLLKDLSKVVRALGGGNPILAALGIGFTLAGMGAEAYGRRVKAAADEHERLLGQLRTTSTDELQAQLAAAESQLQELNAELTRSGQTDLEAASGLALYTRETQQLNPQLQKRADVQAAIVRDLRAELDTRAKLPRATGGPGTTAEQLSRLNAELAAGSTTLSAARQRVAGLLTTTQDGLRGLAEGGTAAASQVAKFPDLLERINKGEDQQLVVNEALHRLRSDETSLLSTQADLTARIGAAAEKQRSETAHRATLLAQIADAEIGLGPYLERMTVLEQLRGLALRGVKDDAIEVLELRRREQELSDTILEGERQRAQATQDRIAAETKELQDLEAAERTFRATTEAGLFKLGGGSEADFRRSAIGRLREQLQLSGVSIEELRAKLASLEGEQAQIEFFGREDELARQRQGLTELIALLGQQQQAEQRLSPELQQIGRVAEQTMDRFADALARGLREGKLSFKDFVDEIEQELLRLFIRMALFQLLGSFIPGLGVAGSLFGGGGGGKGGGVLGLGNLGDFGGGSIQSRFPTPVTPGGVAAAGMDSLVRRIGGLEDAIRGSHFQQIPVTIEGETLRTGIERATRRAGSRKI